MLPIVTPYHCAACRTFTSDVVSNFPGHVVMRQDRERLCWTVMSSVFRERALGEHGADEAIRWAERVTKQREERRNMFSSDLVIGFVSCGNKHTRMSDFLSKAFRVP